MSPAAVDIVLVPDEAMTGFVIAANAALVKKFNSEIILNKNNCLPHISLAMGCIEREEVELAGELLKPLAAIIPRRLKTGGIQKSVSSSGEIVSVIGILRTNKLQKFHEKVSRTVKPFFSYDAREDMVAGGKAGRTTLQWIANFPEKGSYSNFSPHITIGYGELQDIELPRDFAVARLAICHLGNHCTC